MGDSNFDLSAVISSLLGGLFGQPSMAPAVPDPSLGTMAAVPASNPWGTNAAPTIASSQPSSGLQYQPASTGIMGGGPGMSGFTGGGTAASPTGGVATPTAPDPYQSAIGEFARSPALAALIGRGQYMQRPMIARQYGIPPSVPVTAGQTVQQPAKRLGPLERYQLMMAGLK